MRIFSWVTKDTNINFMGMRKPAYVFSSLLVVLSVICIAVKGFNYGIDFSGGILMEVGSSRPVNLEDIRAKVNQVDLDDVNLQTVGETGTEFMIRAQAKELSEKEQMAAVNKIKQVLGTDEFEFRRVELVGPQVGDELKVLSLPLLRFWRFHCISGSALNGSLLWAPWPVWFMTCWLLRACCRCLTWISA